MFTMDEKWSFVILIMFKFEEDPKEKTSYIVGREWGELKKAWEKYNQAKEDENKEKADVYFRKIQRLQEKLGITN